MNNTTTKPPTPQFNLMSAMETNLHLRNFTIAMVVLTAISAILTSVVNFLVILTFSRTKNLLSSTNILILNLAVTDFIVGTFMQPIYCLHLGAMLSNNGHLSQLASRIYSGIFTPIVTVSFLTITAITGDRFLAIRLHLRYHQVVTTQKVLLVSILIWFAGIFWGVVYSQWKEKFAVRMVDNTFALLLLLANLYLMVQISRVIRRHSNQIHTQQQSTINTLNMPKYKKTVNTIYYIMCIFLICYVPMITAVIFDSFTKNSKEIVFAMTIFADFLLMFNSMLNPIVYCLRIQEMRTAIRKIIGFR